MGRLRQDDTPLHSGAHSGPDAAGVTAEALISALNQAHFILEFSPAGELVAANKNFLTLTDSALSSALKNHHDELFPVDLPRVPFDRFTWANLRSGESRTGSRDRLTLAIRHVGRRDRFPFRPFGC